MRRMLRALLWALAIAFFVGFLIGSLLRREIERPVRYIGGYDRMAPPLLPSRGRVPSALLVALAPPRGRGRAVVMSLTK